MKLRGKDSRVLVLGTLASFGVYFCMYAFRKPFTVATYEDYSLWGVNFKIVLVIAQVLGYMVSKFVGIRVISGLRAKSRFPYLMGMILLAELSLVFFGWMPTPYKTVMLFLNGLSLGMIWGVVFSYLEGRRFTEVLGVVLCSSFIVSSGAVKSVGLLVMDRWKVGEFWMPALTGALFVLPFLVFAILLEKIPAPTDEDALLKKQRKPMNREERRNTVINFLFPLIILVFFYLCLTSLRDFRDNFSREIWDALGYEGNASIYTLSEVPVALFVLMTIGLFVFIQNNYRAFLSYHYLLIAGSFFTGLSTLLFQNDVIGPVPWMVTIGLGLYTCYVPFNCLFFDRMIATFRINGNSGFLVYIADSFGYLGSVAVLLYKNFGKTEVSWLQFFIQATYVVAVIGGIVSLLSLLHFKRKYKNRPEPTQAQIPIIEL